MNTPSLNGRRRLVAAFAVPALAASALAVGTTSSYADPTPSGSSGSNWLVGQLDENDLIFNPNFGGFTDYGLSIDTAFAAIAAQRDAGRANDISAAIAAEVESYISGGEDRYSGSTAKALVLAQRTRVDATDFGGVNLVTRLESLVNDQGATSGRLQDQSEFGDFANTIGQTFAVEGLSNADSPRADDVTDFLIAQQCSDGFFRQDFSPIDAADQTCDGAATDASPSVDSTAFAVLALNTRADDPAAARAVAKGVAWLKANQADNGSFGANSNSTGLASSALGSQCEIVAADRAADWIRDLQVGSDEAGSALNDEVGAVAFDRAAFDAGKVNGITTEDEDQWRRASAQATPGLLFETAGTPSVSFGRAPKFGRVGKTRTLRLNGVSAGETVCFGDINTFEPVIGTGAQLKIKVSEDKAGKERYGATTGPGVANKRITWLDRTRFDVRTKSKVERGNKQVVVVRGLERGEKVRVFFEGKRIAKGAANVQGRFFTRFEVNTKPGRTRVKVIGQFFNRKGFDGFKVTR